MARSVTTQHKTIATVAAWIVALLIFLREVFLATGSLRIGTHR